MLYSSMGFVRLSPDCSLNVVIILLVQSSLDFNTVTALVSVSVCF